MKTYITNSVWLNNVPKAHRSSNGNAQFTALLRTNSQKQAAELLGVSLGSLRYNGIRIAPERIGYAANAVPVAGIVVNDHTVYYRVEHTQNGYVGKWFEYSPPTKR